MIWVYLLLFLSGLVLTGRLIARRSGHACTAAAGTLLAGLAILGGFSIGSYLAAIAAVLLMVAGARMGAGTA